MSDGLRHFQINGIDIDCPFASVTWSWIIEKAYSTDERRAPAFRQAPAINEESLHSHEVRIPQAEGDAITLAYGAAWTVVEGMDLQVAIPEPKPEEEAGYEPPADTGGETQSEPESTDNTEDNGEDNHDDSNSESDDSDNM